MADERFLLPANVLARKYVRGERATVVLHDGRGRTVEIGARGWRVAASLDGTRDVHGVAAALKGAATEAEVRAFVGELASGGWATDAEPPARGEERRATPTEEARVARPVEALPGFSLRCDGRGSCCRFYPTIVFSPADAARARAHLPDVLDAGDDETLAFLPERGGDRRSLAVALVDGRCAYLEGDGRCGIHAAAGGKAKPFGCSLYPLSLVDDGKVVRATPSVECACVIESGLHPVAGGAPLLAATTTTELDPRLVVDRLPARIGIAEAAFAPRDEVVAWADEALNTPSENIPDWLFRLASHLAARGLTSVGDRDTPVDETRLRARIETMRSRAAVRAGEAFRSSSDLARATFTLVEIACAIALADLETVRAPSAAAHDEETFMLSAQAFGRQLLPQGGDETLAEALFDRSVRMIVARGMRVAAELAGWGDPALRYPGAMLEAAVRAYGIAG